MDNTQVFAFSNVHLKLYNKKNHRLIKELHKKNTITKYTLNGIASMLKGEFNDTNYIQINRYVPKYLALGTNMPTGDTTITVKNYVTVNDDSLYGEILKNDKPNRVRLEQAKRVDNISTNEFVKIRFKTLVMAGMVSYNTIIQELGLFVDNTDVKGGLFARIATEPITIPENSVLDVQWDIVLTSSTGVYPTSIYLLDDNNNVITEDSGVQLGYQPIPITANLQSSVIDLNNSEQVEAHYTVSDTWETVGDYTQKSATNNFNNVVTYAGIKQEDSVFKIYKWNSRNQHKELYDEQEYSDIDSAKRVVNSNLDIFYTTDINGNIVVEGASANAYKYKDVTYTNCTWNFYNSLKELIEDYDESKSYSAGKFVIHNNTIYVRNNENGDTFESNWDKVMSFIKYMVNVVLINYNETGNDYVFYLESVASTNISATAKITCISK